MLVGLEIRDWGYMCLILTGSLIPKLELLIDNLVGKLSLFLEWISATCGSENHDQLERNRQLIFKINKRFLFQNCFHSGWHPSLSKADNQALMMIFETSRPTVLSPLYLPDLVSECTKIKTYAWKFNQQSRSQSNQSFLVFLTAVLSLSHFWGVQSKGSDKLLLHTTLIIMRE